MSESSGNTKGKRYYEIDGVLEVPENITLDEVMDLFILFVERHDWSFGGGMIDVTESSND